MSVKSMLAVVNVATANNSLLLSPSIPSNAVPASWVADVNNTLPAPTFQFPNGQTSDSLADVSVSAPVKQPNYLYLLFIVVFAYLMLRKK